MVLAGVINPDYQAETGLPVHHKQSIRYSDSLEMKVLVEGKGNTEWLVEKGHQWKWRPQGHGKE